MNNYCYTTLLATNDFLFGVMGLYYSLQKVNSQYPLVVIAVDTLDHNIFNILTNNHILYITVNDQKFQHDKYYNCTLNKFYAWSLSNYDKVLFIDADTVITQNIDFMFDLQPFSACHDNDGRVFGALFLLKPNLEFMNYIFNNYQNYEHDEAVLNDIFHKQLHTTGNWLPDNLMFVYHDAYQPKYWDVYSLKNIEDVKHFIYYDMYVLYLNMINYQNPYISYIYKEVK